MKHLTTLAAVGAMAAVMAIAQTSTPQAAGDNTAPASKSHAQRQLMQALDLTKAQKQQAKTILQATRQQAQPIALQLKQNRQSLSAAIQAGDTATIQQISTAVGNLQGQVLGIRSAGKAQFFGLLTPDQKAKAVEFEQQVHRAPAGKGE